MPSLQDWREQAVIKWQVKFAARKKTGLEIVERELCQYFASSTFWYNSLAGALCLEGTDSHYLKFSRWGEEELLYVANEASF